ncbi:unnamed protein product, partial [Mesorhabditis belari]|uniref:MYND-type domain-containing protein n=1 Tax=Mesorhabditis belari TaxID=2138241 RepID=A0AAF3FCW3_9BILA
MKEAKDSPTRLEFYPFAYALFTEELETYCWYCLQICPQKRHCIGCGLAIFCDKECQMLGWKDHKAECKGFRTAEKLYDIEVRLLGRIVHRYKTIQSGKDKDDPDFYKDRTSQRSFMEVWSHVEQMKVDDFAQKKFDEIYTELLAFYGEKWLLPKDTVFELHCRNYINRHAISDKGYMKEIGKGLYLDLCSYDHSCRPNTIYTCNGFKATLRRLNNSVNLLDKKNTFYSYIDLLCSQQQRRKLLKDTWYFTCECERCLDAKDHLLTSILCPLCSKVEPTEICLWGEDSNKNPNSAIITCKKCNEPLAQNYVLEGIGAMRFIDKVFDDQELEQMPGKTQPAFLQDLLTRFGEILPHVNVYYCRIIQALIPLIPPTDNHELLRLHLMSESCVRRSFPHNHPAVAFHLRNIAIFAGNLGKKEKCLKYFEEAQNILDYTLDADHPMSLENRRLWETAKTAELVKQVEEITIHDGKPKSEQKKQEIFDEDDEIPNDMPSLI